MRNNQPSNQKSSDLSQETFGRIEGSISKYSAALQGGNSGEIDNAKNLLISDLKTVETSNEVNRDQNPLLFTFTDCLADLVNQEKQSVALLNKINEKFSQDLKTKGEKGNNIESCLRKLIDLNEDLSANSYDSKVDNAEDWFSKILGKMLDKLFGLSPESREMLSYVSPAAETRSASFSQRDNIPASVEDKVTAAVSQREANQEQQASYDHSPKPPIMLEAKNDYQKSENYEWALKRHGEAINAANQDRVDKGEAPWSEDNIRQIASYMDQLNARAGFISRVSDKENIGENNLLACAIGVFDEKDGEKQKQMLGGWDHILDYMEGGGRWVSPEQERAQLAQLQASPQQESVTEQRSDGVKKLSDLGLSPESLAALGGLRFENMQDGDRKTTNDLENTKVADIANRNGLGGACNR